MIYCRACGDELKIEVEKGCKVSHITYVYPCDECSANHLTLLNTISNQIKPIGRGILRLVSNAIEGTNDSDRQAAHDALDALIKIEDVLNGMEGI